MHTRQSPDEDFWSDIYSGHPIAILKRGGRWQVYLDRVLQHNTEFATAQQAIAWLSSRVDGGIKSRGVTTEAAIGTRR